MTRDSLNLTLWESRRFKSAGNRFSEAVRLIRSLGPNRATGRTLHPRNPVLTKPQGLARSAGLSG